MISQKQIHSTLIHFPKFFRRHSIGRLTVVFAVVFLGFAFNNALVDSTFAQLNRFRGQQQVKDVSAKDVREAISRGVVALKKRQTRNGSWNKYRSLGDLTALCTLAILNAEDNPDDVQVQKAISYLTNDIGNKVQTTYVISLRVMVLAMADPKGKKYLRAVQNDVDWLVRNQTKTGNNKGGWSYEAGRIGGADSSNSQFALLALHEANLMGATIPEKTWEWAKLYWQATNNRANGGFSYSVGQTRATGSMTAAGISSTIIIEENLADVEALFNGDRAVCCGAADEFDPVKKAIDWIARSFTVRGNPAGGGRGSEQTQLYWLYGLERAGRLSGQRFFGPHDWYRAGSAQLLQKERGASGVWRGHGHGEENSDVATSLALLFLSKGKRPVAIGKYQYQEKDGWDIHPKGVHYLSRNLEEIWGKKLNWQTVDGTKAEVNDLLETPVLFMSGHDAMNLTDKQKDTLKLYIENGGFLFAEACQGDGCGRAPFDDSFRDLMAEIFPDSELAPLDPTHPIWSAHYSLIGNPELAERPVLGLQACCRTSVIYVPTNLSGYWSLRRPVVQKFLEKNRAAQFQKASERIDFCTQLGANVVTYATGRELRDKGETPKFDEKMVSVLVGRAIDMPKLMHGGGQDEAPNAWKNVLKEAQRIGLKIELKKKMVPVEIDRMANFPFVFMHGRSNFEFTPEQREDLKTYLENGGFIFADAICSSAQFAESFENEMSVILGQPLKAIPPSHEMWSDKFGYSIRSLTLRKKDPDVKGGFREIVGPPELRGHEVDGRLVVVFSENDLSCAMENRIVSQCEGYKREDAAKIGVNTIMYRLRGD